MGAKEKNVVVTLDVDAQVEKVVSDLKEKGFNLVERMEIIPCLLGTYGGEDALELKKVEGVLDASLEGTSETQQDNPA